MSLPTGSSTPAGLACGPFGKGGDAGTGNGTDVGEQFSRETSPYCLQQGSGICSVGNWGAFPEYTMRSLRFRIWGVHPEILVTSPTPRCAASALSGGGPLWQGLGLSKVLGLDAGGALCPMWDSTCQQAESSPPQSPARLLSTPFQVSFGARRGGPWQVRLGEFSVALGGRVGTPQAWAEMKLGGYGKAFSNPQELQAYGHCTWLLGPEATGATAWGLCCLHSWQLGSKGVPAVTSVCSLSHTPSRESRGAASVPICPAHPEAPAD